MREPMLADHPELTERAPRAMDLMDAFNTTPARDPATRRRLPTELPGEVGEGVLPANVVAVGNPARVIRTVEAGSAEVGAGAA